MSTNDSQDKKIIIGMSQQSIDDCFRILEYLLFKLTFFALAAVGAYHLIARA